LPAVNSTAKRAYSPEGADGRKVPLHLSAHCRAEEFAPYGAGGTQWRGHIRRVGRLAAVVAEGNKR
jgi:hypothetical protein